jgi:hypothetical protein
VITKSGVIPGNYNKDRPMVPGLARESRVASIIHVSGNRIGDRRLDILRTDAVHPHLILGVTAQPHAGMILARTAAETAP